MARSPLISVIIPVYNGERYIEGCLESVFAQTATDYEIIVVNDGSTDGTRRAIDAYLHRLRYIEQENKGLSGARNTGIRVARGEFIALLDCDDLWLPVFLTEQLRLFEEIPGLDLAHSEAHFWFEGQPAPSLPPVQAGASYREWTSRELLLDLLRLPNVIIPSTTLARRAMYEKSGFFDQEMRYCEDREFHLRVAAAGCRVARNQRTLLIYRRRHGSLSSDVGRMAYYRALALRKALGAGGVPDDLQPVAHAEIRKHLSDLRGAAVAHLLQGEPGHARECFGRAWRFRPWDVRNAAGVLLAAVAPWAVPRIAAGLRRFRRSMA